MFIAEPSTSASSSRTGAANLRERSAAPGASGSTHGRNWTGTAQETSVHEAHVAVKPPAQKLLPALMSHGEGGTRHIPVRVADKFPDPSGSK